MKLKMIIELLSDLCVADGGVYNSLIDTDVCYDKYGFPYIPGKRIKGCIRENALELKDWGMDINVDQVFGSEGEKEKASRVRIDNAYLENYDKRKKEVIGSSNRKVYHPQNVLQQYTYIRTQTSIDYETGVAKDKSLRTTRVVNKGNTFVAYVYLNSDDDFNTFKKCAESLSYIGLSRTRGFGEVKITIEKDNSDEGVASNESKNHLKGDTVLKYKISLDEPMICKSINGGESNSMDYIEGSKIIGLLASRIKNDKELKEILDSKGLIFSNAYIAKDNQRMMEVPAYIYSIKNDSKHYINRLIYDRDKSNAENEKRQLNIMKHCYVCLKENGDLVRQSVEMEERYHHSRPNDKSIGHAVESDDMSESKFYQLSSIQEGQTFVGYIYGDFEVISKIYDVLRKVDTCYMGYGRSAEYGKARFDIEGAGHQEGNKEVGKEFVVILKSPTIVYNDKAMYSTKIDDLENTIKKTIGLNNRCEIGRYVQFTQVGGYNVTWQEKKPVLGAFDKGSSLNLVFEQETEINTGKTFFVGERIQEGYGECVIEKVKDDQNCKQLNIVSSDLSREKASQQIGELGQSICSDLLKMYMRKVAYEMAKSEKDLSNENVRSTVSNMIMMENENKTIEGIKKSVQKRYEKNSKVKTQKKEFAQKIIKNVEGKSVDIFSGFNKLYGVEYKGENIDLEKHLLRLYLQELKYRIREKSNKPKGGNSNESK